MRPPACGRRSPCSAASPRRNHLRSRLSEASGSRQWASKPAEMTMRSGAKASTAGRMRAGEGLAELGAASARRERRVEDVADAGLGRGARAGIERHLVGRGVEDGRVGPDDRLGAVAVVDVPVDDGDAGGAVGPLGVAGGDDGVVEEAEAHGLARLRRGGPADARRRRRWRRCRHHRVDGEARRARGARAAAIALRRQRRVGVEPGEALGRDRLADRGDVGSRHGRWRALPRRPTARRGGSGPRSDRRPAPARSPAAGPAARDGRSAPGARGRSGR